MSGLPASLRFGPPGARAGVGAAAPRAAPAAGGTGDKRRDEVRPHGGPAVAPAGWRNDALAVVIGVAAWFVFARVLHPWLIGVAVWPGQA